MKRKLRFIVTFLISLFSIISNVNAYYHDESKVKYKDPCYGEKSCTILCSYVEKKDNGSSPDDYNGIWIVYKDNYGSGGNYEIAFDVPHGPFLTSEGTQRNSFTDPEKDFILKPLDAFEIGQGIDTTKETTSEQLGFISSETYNNLVNNGECPTNAYISTAYYDSLLSYTKTICFENNGEEYCSLGFVGSSGLDKSHE